MANLRVFSLILTALILLNLRVDAGITDCAPGYRFDRMSGVGCVQDKCTDVSHAFYNYVGYCVCYACGDAGCSGDKEFSKECRRSPDYAGCPRCLYACVNPNAKCPGENEAKNPGESSATTVKGQITSTTAAKPQNDRIRVKVKGKVSAFGHPLRHLHVTCMGKEVEIDAKGNYEFDAGELERGQKFRCEMRLEYVRDGKTYFIIQQSPTDSDPMIWDQDFTVDDSTIQWDWNLDKLFRESDSGSEAYVSAFLHMSEALEFYVDGLGEKLDFQLPLHVKLFTPDDPNKPKAAYNGDNGVSTIEFQERASVQDAPGRQVMFYHEFSHYVMQALYGRWPSAEGGNYPTREENHGGFINPSSSDSYVEGFAVFMSVMMAEEYGNTVPSGKDYSKMSFMQLLREAENAPITNLEADYTAWDRQGKMEEYAVAGVLWDLVDGEDDYKTQTPQQMYERYLDAKKEAARMNEEYKDDPDWEPVVIPEYTLDYFKTVKLDDDNAELDPNEVWKVLRTYKGDFTEVYNSLKDRFPNDKPKIDGVFAKHGFFEDTRKGNSKYDDYEPYIDANKNGKFDEGEYFVDYSSEEPKYQQGMKVGTASNYQRGWRKTTQEIPGQYVKVNNNVPYYDIAVFYPNQPHLNQAYRTENRDGRIYIDVPPPGYNATLLVQAEGVETGRPLTLSAEKFNKEYSEAAKRGYYLNHDFEVKGPIPPKPRAPKGLLPNKQEAHWLWVAAGGAAVAGMIAVIGVSILLIIAGVLLHKKIKKMIRE